MKKRPNPWAVRNVPTELIDRLNVHLAKEKAKTGHKVTQGEAVTEALSDWLRKKGEEREG